jgi:hypothetical protein
MAGREPKRDRLLLLRGARLWCADASLCTDLSRTGFDHVPDRAEMADGDKNRDCFK